jgi:alanyl-tRNA synthetase
MAEANAAGADAFFDEKYGEKVRTIRVEGYSHELCGGTHAHATGQIGGFVITGERSIGSGMRRIEALTGAGADRYVDERLERLDRAADAVGARTPDQLEERIAALQDELRTTKQRLKAGAAAGGGRPKPEELAGRAEEVSPGVRLVTWTGDAGSIEELKGYARDVRSALGDGVIALGLDADEPQLFVTVSDDLVGKGVAAGALVQGAIGAIDGRGGGRPQMAQGKGTRREGLGEALATIRTSLARSA